MNILVFGATGGTGKQIVFQAIQKGYHVTAFVRNPAALHFLNDKKVTIITGNILDKKQVQSAMKGQNVVISALGNKTFQAVWKKNTLISEAIQNIISAMQKLHVNRLLFLSSFGVNENIFYPEKIFIRLVLKNIFADIPTQEKYIIESNLDWTVVRPARLTNDIGKEIYQAGEDLWIYPFSKISRADVADFLLKQVINKTLIGKTVTIRY